MFDKAKTSKIHFRKEADKGFYETLKSRVDQFIQSKKRTSYSPAILTFVLIGLYCFFFSMIFITENLATLFFSYFIMGILMTTIFLNIVHDAAHNALFRSPVLNRIAFSLIEIFGVDSFIWKKRHIAMHHSYPNIVSHDCDVRQSKYVRLIPGTPFMAHHYYQAYYVPILYFFYTLNWLLIRDFIDAFKFGKEFKVNSLRKIKLILQKAGFLFLLIFLPAIVSVGSVYIYFAGFMVLQFTASVVGVMALTTAHVSHDSEFPQPDDTGNMPDSWAIHQLRVTQDFATNNLLISSCFGGFNFHVAHHLFPSVHHRHYRKITAIIKHTAEEFGLEYKSKNLGDALRSHYQLLVNNSRHPVEIDM